MDCKTQPQKEKKQSQRTISHDLRRDKKLWRLTAKALHSEFHRAQGARWSVYENKRNTTFPVLF